MTLKKLSLLCITSCLIIELSAIPGFTKARWTANSVWPPNTHQSAGLLEFAEKVKELTGGELEINGQITGENV